MGIKHLQAITWAVCLVSAVGALAQPGAIDSDSDGVPDHTDLCPQTAGSPNNSGCPADEEVVIVYGTTDSYSSVECPDGSTASYYTDCPGFENWAVYNLAFHDEAGSYYTGQTTRVTVVSEEEDASDGEHEFADLDCDDGITTCWTLGDWYAFCSMASGNNIYTDAYCDDILGLNGINVEEILAAFAREYPATTCVTGIVLGSAIATFVKRPPVAGKIGWAITTATITGCAIWTDIRDD